MSDQEIQLNTYAAFLSYFLPDGLLNYFEPIKAESHTYIQPQTKKRIPAIHLYFDEKDNRTDATRDYSPKGFAEETTINDFPARDRKLVLHVRRRRWITPDGKTTYLDIYGKMTADGTRFTEEFGSSGIWGPRHTLRLTPAGIWNCTIKSDDNAYIRSDRHSETPMKIRKALITAAAAAAAFIMNTSCDELSSTRKIPFDDGWTFTLDRDTSTSREVTLPHDWSIEKAFSKDAPCGTGGGALDGGFGTYTKTFTVPVEMKGKRAVIDFDGVYWCSTVIVNGDTVGFRPSGYVSFSYDITDNIAFGNTNTIQVDVDNSHQPNSRWYSGSGIYRHVWLNWLDPVHIGQWGVSVVTGAVSADGKEAEIPVSVKVVNESDVEKEFFVRYGIDAAGNGPDISAASDITSLAPHSEYTDTITLRVKDPHLWSDTDPYLYRLATTVLGPDGPLDEVTTPFGIRTFRFDPDSGLILNGEKVLIKGVCDHHDLGALGTAVNTSALRRQLTLLKEMGCNGIRTSHNPPAPELLDLCDEMGFIVQDEFSDVWMKGKTPYDYSNWFTLWYERDVTDWILRDRNHPCILCWSIGNEVLEQWADQSAEGFSLEQTNLLLNFASQSAVDSDGLGDTNGARVARLLAETVRKTDTTRPISAGCNGTEGNCVLSSGAPDIIGINYHNPYLTRDYLSNKFPGMPILLTETTSGLMSRGWFGMPSDTEYIWPARWDIPFDTPHHHCSAYDNCRVPWGSTHEDTWKIVKERPFISGMYIWTGFDYIGEPTPYSWPSRSSYFGIIDLAGIPKDVYYMYQSEWTDKEMIHLLPHWNHTPGDTVDVWCYYNGADEVELFINGASQGRSTKTPDRLHAQWRTVYEPGELKAVAYRGGEAVMEQAIRTAGEPASIRLTADRTSISASERELCFIAAEVLDADGIPCPTASNLIEFSVSRGGAILGTDNGCPIDTTCLKDPERHLFSGKCVAIAGAQDMEKGTFTVSASSESLTGAELTVEVRK